MDDLAIRQDEMFLRHSGHIEADMTDWSPTSPLCLAAKNAWDACPLLQRGFCGTGLVGADMSATATTRSLMN